MGTKTKRHLARVDLHLVLRDGNRVLLQLRQGTGWGDGLWHLPAGHLEQGENAYAGIVREAHEELGVFIDWTTLTLAHVMHNSRDRIGLFFETEWCNDIPTIREPEKCAALEWFDLADLPVNMVEYALVALDCIGDGEVFSAYGWLDEEREKWGQAL